ncbi:MAG: hypothetical protein PUC54_03470 [Clostridiales bacterium]|nr:hypothetical protein [Clostridiales bacterium]
MKRLGRFLSGWMIIAILIMLHITNGEAFQSSAEQTICVTTYEELKELLLSELRTCVRISDNIVVIDDMDVPANVVIKVDADKTLTVDNGATLTLNNDVFTFKWSDEEVIDRGTWIVNKGSKIINKDKRGLSSSILIDNGGCLINEGGTISIADKRTEVLVKAGGSLENYGIIEVRNGGKLTIEYGGVYYEPSENSSKHRLVLHNLTDEFSSGGTTITGIDDSQIVYYGQAVNESEIREVLKRGYRAASIDILNNISITNDLTIPKNMLIKSTNLTDESRILTVENDVELVLYGNCSVSGSTILIRPYGKIINNGYWGINTGGTTIPDVGTKLYPGKLVVESNGTFINRGRIHCTGEIVNDGLMVNGENAIIENYFDNDASYNNTIAIKNNGIIMNYGTIANTQGVTGIGIIKNSNSNVEVGEQQGQNEPMIDNYKLTESGKLELNVITNGATQNGILTYETHSGVSIALRVNAEMSTFQSIYMDGTYIDPSNYTLRSGSTIIEFRPEFMDSLGIGRHTLEVHHTIGTGIINFMVKESKALSMPKTGDAAMTGYITVLMCISVMRILRFKRK